MEERIESYQFTINKTVAIISVKSLTQIMCFIEQSKNPFKQKTIYQFVIVLVVKTSQAV